MLFPAEIKMEFYKSAELFVLLPEQERKKYMAGDSFAIVRIEQIRRE